MNDLSLKKVYSTAYKSLGSNEVCEINLDGNIIEEINERIIELSNDGLMEINVNMKNLLASKIFKIKHYYESFNFFSKLHFNRNNKKLILHISWDIEKIIHNMNDKEKIKDLENIMETVKGY